MNDTERQAKLRMALPEVRTKYKEMASNVDKAGHLILELMRHPDTPSEMVAEAQASYARTYAMFTQMRDSLRKLYRPSLTLTSHPWGK